jgi:hypothetical protein
MVEMPQKMEPIKVKCYSGYKANERPVAFIHRDREYQIESVESQICRRSSSEKALSMREFKVRLKSGELCILIFDEAIEEWYIKEWKAKYLF